MSAAALSDRELVQRMRHQLEESDLGDPEVDAFFQLEATVDLPVPANAAAHDDVDQVTLADDLEDWPDERKNGPRQQQPRATTKSEILAQGSSPTRQRYDGQPTARPPSSPPPSSSSPRRRKERSADGGATQGTEEISTADKQRRLQLAGLQQRVEVGSVPTLRLSSGIRPQRNRAHLQFSQSSCHRLTIMFPCVGLITFTGARGPAPASFGGLHIQC